MSAYTKGPWIAVRIDDGIYEVRCSNPDKLPVVVIDRHRDGHAPTREVTTPADARLIASAPEMYEFLKRLAERKPYMVGDLSDLIAKAVLL
jgi:hypothetical protein